MQVPQGHMAQQVLDSNGYLTHVILSPDPMTMGTAADPSSSPATVGGAAAASGPPTMPMPVPVPIPVPAVAPTAEGSGADGSTPAGSNPAMMAQSGTQYIPMTVYVSGARIFT